MTVDAFGKTGPAVDAQEIPDTPVMVQVAVPIGVWPPLGPVTVAENVKVLPSEVVGALVVTKTAGVTFRMLTPSEIGPTEL